MRAVKWILLISIIFFSTEGYAAVKFENTKKSAHFVIYYQQAPVEYINQVARKAEHCYRSITEYLGYRRFNFWLWDNRCKIFLYPNREEYLKDTGCASWSSGHVYIIKKEIRTYIWQDKFFDTILPHEMGHIIFREFVGYKKTLPLWLDEGVACMQESDSQERLVIAKGLVRWKLYIDLNELSKIKTTSLIMPFIFYSQSASTVDFLLRNYGRKKFVDFCRQLRDEENWEEALKSVYNLKDLKQLEELWSSDLTEARDED